MQLLMKYKILFVPEFVCSLKLPSVRVGTRFASLNFHCDGLFTVNSNNEPVKLNHCILE